MRHVALTLVAAAAAAISTNAGIAADRVEVGARAPELTLNAADGETRTLADLRDDQAALLVFFRGLW